MNRLEILDALQYLPLQTYGVYPADQIPKVWTKPAAFIVNNQDHTKPGKHWTAMYVDRAGKGTYFDSFGRAPSVQNHIDRLRKNCKYFRWSTQKLQSENSDVCGQFCIMFCYFLSNGFGLHRFNDVFSSNLKNNDEIVRKFYKNLNDKKISQRENVKTTIMRCSTNCCEKYK